ncbi:DUF2817 domain-containing protein [Cellvibrio sp. pealriver]|uniref:DUF2817 domain-containing protein n=1 Tax=Cellvibrio sp. pealriver TaxID=1622269 RepID=UPI00069ED01C|nr:DUF2817 domain-containing protein [Cellvibrio sp. pealriver]
MTIQLPRFATPQIQQVIAQRSTDAQQDFAQKIPELMELERLILQHSHIVNTHTEILLESAWGNFPLYSLTLGNKNPTAPTLLMTGGMHGIERIGSQVLLAWLQTLLARLQWDSHLQQLLDKIQLVLVPILNPVGMYLNQRANGNGVDLNRNAPIDAEGRVPLLGGGHRLGPFLPWYRGRKRGKMEAENIALEVIMQRQIFNRPFAAVLDLHSGLGMQDRLWFPHAYRKKAIGNIAEYVAMKTLWERSYPNHTYLFEPQSIHYLSHGDLWDYFYYQSRAQQQPYFLPLTLEMGSWLWVKKSPRQLLNMAGLFNPQIQHRHTRVLRRHILLLDFLLAATLNHPHWLPDEKQAGIFRQTANNLWFNGL